MDGLGGGDLRDLEPGAIERHEEDFMQHHDEHTHGHDHAPTAEFPRETEGLPEAARPDRSRSRTATLSTCASPR